MSSLNVVVTDSNAWHASYGVARRITDEGPTLRYYTRCNLQAGYFLKRSSFLETNKDAETAAVKK
jgi:hypothetical protein